MICIKVPSQETFVSCPNHESKSVDVKAPLDVTRVEKILNRVSQGQVRLTVEIYLSKQGKVTLLLPGSISGISDDTTNKVYLREVSFIGKSLDVVSPVT